MNEGIAIAKAPSLAAETVVGAPPPLIPPTRSDQLLWKIGFQRAAESGWREWKSDPYTALQLRCARMRRPNITELLERQQYNITNVGPTTTAKGPGEVTMSGSGIEIRGPIERNLMTFRELVLRNGLTFPVKVNSVRPGHIIVNTGIELPGQRMPGGKATWLTLAIDRPKNIMDKFFLVEARGVQPEMPNWNELELKSEIEWQEAEHRLFNLQLLADLVDKMCPIASKEVSNLGTLIVEATQKNEVDRFSSAWAGQYYQQAALKAVERERLIINATKHEIGRVLDEAKSANLNVEAELTKMQTLRKQLEDMREKLQADQARLEPQLKLIGTLEPPNDRRREPAPPCETPRLRDIEEVLGDTGTQLTRQSAILATLTAALTGSLVIFDGPVGTGKSTLAETLARRVGGNCRVIPVRPSWVEPADLLGFYDPLSRVFRPGPLVEDLHEATPNRLYTIVLDELNLARIENYGADLLSRMGSIAEARWKGEPTAPLRIWSKAEFSSLLKEFCMLESAKDSEPSQVYRREQLRAALAYRYEEPVPDGLVFIGTTNTDDTTYDISPKVIDRAFALGFPRADLTTRRVRSGGSDGTKAVSIQTLRAQANPHESSAGSALWKAVVKYVPDDLMATIGIPYSHRFQRDLHVFAGVATATETDVSTQITTFLFTRVLPRVRCYKRNLSNDDNSRLGKMIEELLKLSNDPAWTSLLVRLKHQKDDQTSDLIRYWRAEGGR